VSFAHRGRRQIRGDGNDTKAKPRENGFADLGKSNGLFAYHGPFGYQHGTQRQHRGAQALIQPGPQPQ
jgi:hypothetical protein